MGLLDVLKKGAGTALNPFGKKPKDPLDVGNSNNRNYNAFMNTDYSKFKDAQGNFVPSSLIGTNVGIPPAPNVSMPNLPAAPSLSPPMPTLMPGISPPPSSPSAIDPSIPSTAGIGLPHPDLSGLTPGAVQPPITSVKPSPSIAPPAAFTPNSGAPGLFNDGAGGLTYSKTAPENNQYGYWGAGTYNTPTIAPPSAPGGPSSYAQAFFNGQPVTTAPKARL